MDRDHLVIYADGASRGNPGPAALGSALFDASGRELLSIARHLGRATNNQAEYQALLAGLRAARELGARSVEVRMDSELVVRQIEGRYRVRNEVLRPLYNEAISLLMQFSRATVRHVPREQNRRADALANQALNAALREDARRDRL